VRHEPKLSDADIECILRAPPEVTNVELSQELGIKALGVGRHRRLLTPAARRVAKACGLPTTVRPKRKVGGPIRWWAHEHGRPFSEIAAEIEREVG
jgi:hypothetical protein